MYHSRELSFGICRTRTKQGRAPSRVPSSSTNYLLRFSLVSGSSKAVSAHHDPAIGVRRGRAEAEQCNAMPPPVTDAHQLSLRSERFYAVCGTVRWRRIYRRIGTILPCPTVRPSRGLRKTCRFAPGLIEILGAGRWWDASLGGTAGPS